MASTNFRVFNEANAPANTYNDSEYQNATQRQSGVIPGMAISRMHNKMYFQWSSMATAIAQYLVSRGYDCNDNDIAGIVSALENSCGLNIRQDATSYAVGDIAYSAALSSVLFLECTTAGTTASSIPAALTGAAEGDSITDGTVVWIVRKIASMADVRAASPGQRQASTAYAVDDMASLGSLPYGWYLECTTAGTTSASDLVITSPAVGDTVTDGTVIWTIRKVADTTDATTTTHGLMSASDKTKLNGIEANANNYSLPTASASVKGGIKVGSGLSMSGETLNNTYSYTLPTATSSVLGGVKIGSNITVSNGTISLTSGNVTNALGYTPPTTNTTYSTGTTSYSGTTKLYTGLGDNTDGTMTQKAIKAIVGLGSVNTRTVITTSGTWTAPASGYYKVTCIGGGGAGGNGGTAKGGKAGSRGGSTSFGSYLTANGGHSGGGGGEYGSGGGGAAGDVAVAYLSLTSGSSVTVTIGAGGTAPSSGDSGSTAGESGSGGAAGGGAFLGGQGAISAYGSGNSGCLYYVAASSSWYGSVPSGTGGSNGTKYGGGGGGGNSNHSNYNPCYSASGGGNGSAGATITTNGSTYPQGGAGGNGAVIIEYYSA